MAGVTPTFSHSWANSNSVFPNTSWNNGGIPLVSETIRSPVSLSKIPGACHKVAASSAGFKALSFTSVCAAVWPFMSFIFFQNLCQGSDIVSIHRTEITDIQSLKDILLLHQHGLQAVVETYQALTPFIVQDSPAIKFSRQGISQTVISLRGMQIQ